MTVKSDPGGFPQRRLGDVPAVTAAQMREIQRVAQEDYGLDILQITENAGLAAAQLALAMLGGRGGKGQRVLVLAGGGNKGAAGLCAVRHMVNWGLFATPVLAEVETEMSFVARRQIHTLRASGVADPGNESSEIDLEDRLAAADLVVDALVGYGLEGPPSGMAAAVTELAMDAKKPVLALDLPTGVNATSGEPSQPSIRACTTLMLDLPKRGLLEPAGRQAAGELYLADLGLPRAAYQRVGISISGLFAEGPIVRVRR
jgi:NAD(P)H-hydrate epimerase